MEGSMLDRNNMLARKRLDERLAPLRDTVRRIPTPSRGWLRAIREALGMTATQFARRLGIARQSADDLEKSEAAGAITLASLRRAAAALDCTLVYALVPNRSLEETVRARAKAIAAENLRRVAHTMALEDQQAQHGHFNEEVEAYVNDFVKERDLWNSP
jgi:predicted DNA-binding mobile mystery protein A